ncbi:hypothetical protein GCM10027258_94920 [Amycolatopsis stemonae]
MPTVRIGTAAGMTARLERGIDAFRERAPEFDVVLADLPVEARLNALRQGDLDLALPRGVRSVPGLEVLPAWTERLYAVVSRRHPAADRRAVGRAELAGGTLRLPAREHDPPLHDAVARVLSDTGWQPAAGRPTGTLQETIVEVGSEPRSWTVLPADQVAEIRSTRVRAIPLEPPVTIAAASSSRRTRRTARPSARWRPSVTRVSRTVHSGPRGGGITPSHAGRSARTVELMISQPQAGGPLAGTAALVTGASSGIGEGTALALAALGARVTVVARRADRLDALVEKITSTGGHALAVSADITDEEQAQAPSPAPSRCTAASTPWWPTRAS